MKEAVEAIRSGDARAFERLLESEPDLALEPNLVVDAGRFANEGALRLLLDRGADPNAIRRGYRALHALIQEDPHTQTKAGAERLACLEVLLASGADPALCAAFPPASALLIAAFSGEKPFVERLLEAKRPDAFEAAALGRVRAVEEALAKDPDFAQARADGGLTALQCACASRVEPRKNLVDVATGLLDAGADPNATVKGWSHVLDTAYFAIGSRHVELTELLLERGADPTSALPTAVWNGDENLSELVLASGAVIDEARHGANPLLNELIRWGRTTNALWLLERGASPDLVGLRGWTALHQAVSRGSERLVAALVAAGADVTVKDEDGLTPLALARAKRKPKVAALLA